MWSVLWEGRRAFLFLVLDIDCGVLKLDNLCFFFHLYVALCIFVFGVVLRFEGRFQRWQESFGTLC